MHKILLFFIIILAFFTRSFFWFYGYNENAEVTFWTGLVLHGDGYFSYSKLFIENLYKEGLSLNSINYDWFRWYQVMYPLYMTPIFLFDLHPSLYIFLLHHFFLMITILLIYLSGSLIGNKWVGLIAALGYACQLHIAFWFNFTLPSVTFHFHLSIFMYCSLLAWKNMNLFSIFLCLLSGLVLGFIRPEGFLIFLSGFFILTVLVLKQLLKIKTLIFSCLIFLVSISLIGYFSFKNNVNLQNKILANTHVGWGLYYGSQESPTNAAKVDEMLHEMFNKCNYKNDNDPLKRGEWWWCSKLGIERIKADPIYYIKVLMKRFPSTIYPSFYREGISWRYKLVMRSTMFFITFGILLLFLIRFKNNLHSLYLILLALPIYLIVTIYQNEWDIRTQLSAQVFLLTSASLGWFRFIERILKKNNYFLSK